MLIKTIRLSCGKEEVSYNYFDDDYKGVTAETHAVKFILGIIADLDGVSLYDSPSEYEDMFEPSDLPDEWRSFKTSYGGGFILEYANINFEGRYVEYSDDDELLPLLCEQFGDYQFFCEDEDDCTTEELIEVAIAMDGANSAAVRDAIMDIVKRYPNMF